MKKQIFKAAALAAAMVVTFASCSDSDDNNNVTPENPDNITVAEGETLKIYGEYRVEAGQTMTIGAGATILAENKGDDPTYILVEQGAKIIANGTADQPIVMTSENDETTWGGLHICGKAPINVEGNALSEIGNEPYGGTDSNDNSGSLEYVIILNSGYALNEETEANGLTLYGVGAGTKVENIAVIDGKDDGIEWFGGSVTASNLITVNCGDDSFDWTNGWTSEDNENWLAVHQGGFAGDCLIEADGGPSSDSANPSNPEIDNVILLGNDNGSKTNGINLKKGTFGRLSNVWIGGKTTSIKMDTNETDAAFAAATSGAKLEDVKMSGDFLNTSDDKAFANPGTVTTTADVLEQVQGAKASWAKFAAKYID